MSRHKPNRRRRFGVRQPALPAAAQAVRAGPGDTDEQDGLVIANHGKAIVVEDSSGQAHRCVARRRVDRAVSGDRVRWRLTAAGSGVITRVLPRHSVLERPDDRHGTRSIAANLDQIVAVIAPHPAFQETLLDRYLVTAEYTGIRPLIVFNKTDLLSSEALAGARRRLAPFSGLGYRLRLASAKLEHGLDALVEELRDRSSILVGQSGVGKSTLVKKLLPDADIAVGHISKSTRLGRHTTTATTRYHLTCGGDIVDSPGVRDFGLWHIPAEDIAGSFVEFREYLGGCRFRDCTHRHEPECALRAAVNEGHIQLRRFESYHTIVAGMSA